MIVAGDTFNQDALSSYLLSCIGWAGDLTPMGSEGHIRLNRTRVAPNPQGMGEPRGFHQDTEVSSAPTQRISTS